MSRITEGINYKEYLCNNVIGSNPIIKGFFGDGNNLSCIFPSSIDVIIPLSVDAVIALVETPFSKYKGTDPFFEDIKGKLKLSLSQKIPNYFTSFNVRLNQPFEKLKHEFINWGLEDIADSLDNWLLEFMLLSKYGVHSNEFSPLFKLEKKLSDYDGTLTGSERFIKEFYKEEQHIGIL